MEAAPEGSSARDGHRALCKGSRAMPPGNHITQRWLQGWGHTGQGEWAPGVVPPRPGGARVRLGRGARARGAAGWGSRGGLSSSWHPEGLALERYWSLWCGSSVGCGGGAEPSVQGWGDAGNPFWPCESQRSWMPAGCQPPAPGFPLQNALWQGWPKAGGTKVAPACSQRAATGT